jgi:hypothetical protein
MSRRGGNDDSPRPVEPAGRLPIEPWMKYTGVSKLAALIVWFRMPRRHRKHTLAGARVAMLVFLGLVVAFLGVAGLVLLVDRVLHG